MSAPTENVEEDKLVASVRAGANLIRAKPLFSYDSKLLFCCGESLVRVYSTTSGECVHDLLGHTDIVTGIAINSQNKLQLLSCSLDQTVIFWDYTDAVLLKRIRLRTPLHGIWMVPRATGPDHVQVLQQRTPSVYVCDLVRYHLLTVSKAPSPTATDIEKISRDQRCVAIGCKGKFVAAVRGDSLFVKSLTTTSSSHPRKFQVERGQSLTCVACHPISFCMATGLSNGVILLWWNFMGEQSRVATTTLHWHAVAVLDVTFTREGSYLLSGGHECVLVKWQFNSEVREHKPRLGAPLCYVTVSDDNQMYATSHQDNMIQLLSNSLRVTQVYQGLTKAHLPHQLRNLGPAGLMFDSRSKALVMNGKPGHLQFYLVHSDRQLYNLDITCQNYVSSENLKHPLDVTEVISADFSTTGSWLATVESWDNRVMTPELRLKFWHFRPGTQTYTLNTTVEIPHDKTIVCLRFRPDPTDPTEAMVVTTSEDGKFKIWSNVDDTNMYRANTRWACDAVGFYHDRPAGVCAFTADGSLLGVVFDFAITLWDPDENILRETLTSPQTVGDGKVRFLEFGSKSCCHLLVSGTQSAVTVWDLITCTVAWSVDLETTNLIVDPLSDVMAIFGSSTKNRQKQQRLYIFRPSDPSYLYCHSDMGKDVVGGVFIPHQKKSSSDKSRQLSWQSQSQLYWLNGQQDLMTLDVERPSTSPTISIHSNLPPTPFSAFLSADRKKGFGPISVESMDTDVYVTATQFTTQLLETASHVQAPVTSLCRRFIQSLLIRDKSEFQTTHSDDEDVDEKTESDMDDGMDIDNAVHSQTPQKDRQNVNTDSDKTITDGCAIPNLNWYWKTLRKTVQKKE